MNPLPLHRRHRSPLPPVATPRILPDLGRLALGGAFTGAVGFLGAVAWEGLRALLERMG